MPIKRTVRDVIYKFILAVFCMGDKLVIVTKGTSLSLYGEKCGYEQYGKTYIYYCKTGWMPLMPKSIVLDAGHGGRDNGAVYEDQIEKNDNLRIVLALGQELEDRGISVFYTRTTDIYQTPYEKAQIANETDADIFLSIHRNSSPNPGEYAGVESLVYKKEGIALQLAENIVGALGLVGYEEIGVSERPGLIVLRRTKMPAVLAEIGFINQTGDNQILEENFQDMVAALADAVQGTMEPAVYPAGESRVYQVQVGSFREPKEAAAMAEKVTESGFPAMVDRQQQIWRVLVGRYQVLDNAVLMERALRLAGYSTKIMDI